MVLFFAFAVIAFLFGLWFAVKCAAVAFLLLFVAALLGIVRL